MPVKMNKRLAKKKADTNKAEMIDMLATAMSAKEEERTTRQRNTTKAKRDDRASLVQSITDSVKAELVPVITREVLASVVPMVVEQVVEAMTKGPLPQMTQLIMNSIPKPQEIPSGMSTLSEESLQPIMQKIDGLTRLQGDQAKHVISSLKKKGRVVARVNRDMNGRIDSLEFI